MGLKTQLRLAVLGVVLSSPLFAQGIEPCLNPHADAAALYDALGADGWHAPEASDADVAERLLWINAVTYLGGDMGGETLASVVDRQRMAASNYGRLKALPTSETRILTDGASMMLATWHSPTPGTAIVQCRLAVNDPKAQTSRSGGRFGTHLSAHLSAENSDLMESEFYYDRAAITAELPGANPPDLVVHIRHQFAVEAGQ